MDTKTGAVTRIGDPFSGNTAGGDIMPKMVKAAHSKEAGVYTCISIHMNDLPAHLAHGDYVPGTGGRPCTCP